jgi:hypothetical protein
MLKTSRGRSEEINFESALDEMLTPLIVNAGVANVLGASERGVGSTTIELTGEINIRGEDPIRLNRRFAGPQASAFAAAAAAIPLGALLRADFEGLEITGLNLAMTAVDGSKTASVERVAVDKTQVRAGETVTLTAFQRTASGKIIEQTTQVTIPAGTAPGAVSIMVGDGNAVQQNTAITQFVPKAASDLIATINRLKRPDRLYAVLTRTSTGAVVGSSEMPNLPPSALATIINDRTAGSKPTVNTVIAELELPAGEYIVSGSQTLVLEIVK